VHRRRDFISERLGALAVERDIRLIISSPRQKQQEDDVTSIIVRKILGWRSVPRQSTSRPVCQAVVSLASLAVTTESTPPNPFRRDGTYRKWWHRRLESEMKDMVVLQSPVRCLTHSLGLFAHETLFSPFQRRIAEDPPRNTMKARRGSRRCDTHAEVVIRVRPSTQSARKG
jgi:hypothetical protein